MTFWIGFVVGLAVMFLVFVIDYARNGPKCGSCGKWVGFSSARVRCRTCWPD